jgi:hypothetical protein
MGYAGEDEEEYFASSIGNGMEVNWLADRLKQYLLSDMQREE